MNWQQQITEVRNAYRNSKSPEQPISKANYIVMLRAFKFLALSTTISDAYGTDFRRNLPGGGLSGFQMTTLPQCIANAETFASNNNLYPAAGEGIAENIRAILELTAPNVAQGVLVPLQGTFQSICAGNL